MSHKFETWNDVQLAKRLADPTTVVGAAVAGNNGGNGVAQSADGIHLPSDESGGPDQSDSTKRVTLQSWQTNGQHFYGELVRLDGMGPITKNAIAMRLPRPALSSNSSLAGQTTGDLLIVGPTNIGFETDTSGWSAVGSATLARDAVTQQFIASGSGAMKIAMPATTAAGQAGVQTTLTGLIAGNLYVARAWCGAFAGGPRLTLSVDATAAPTALQGVTGVQAVSPVSSYTPDGLLHQLIAVFRATATSHVLSLTNAATTPGGSSAWVDQVYVTPPLTDPPRTVGWIVSHYEAQSGGSVHGHLSFEVPDANDNLQTRFEIPFIDLTTNKVGVDKTQIKTNAADFTVRCVGADHTGATQQQVLRVGGFPGTLRPLEFSSDQETGDPAKKRWWVQATNVAESGSNVGSDLAVTGFSDTGSPQSVAIVMRRSNGQVIFGGSALVTGAVDGAGEGVQINRNHAGVALTINTNLTGGTGSIGYAHQALDATSRAISTTVGADSTARFVAYADGKHEFGPGGSTARDTNLYRSAAGQLTTDTEFKVGTNLRIGAGTLGGGAGVFSVGNATTVPTTNPTGGGVLYASAGALVWRGSNGTVTTIAPA